MLTSNHSTLNGRSFNTGPGLLQASADEWLLLKQTLNVTDLNSPLKHWNIKGWELLKPQTRQYLSLLMVGTNSFTNQTRSSYQLQNEEFEHEVHTDFNLINVECTHKQNSTWSAHLTSTSAQSTLNSSHTQRLHLKYASTSIHIAPLHIQHNLLKKSTQTFKESEQWTQKCDQHEAHMRTSVFKGYSANISTKTYDMAVYLQPGKKEACKLHLLSHACSLPHRIQVEKKNWYDHIVDVQSAH